MKIIPFLCLAVLSVCVSSCGIYSFTGANIDPNLNSVSVNLFEDKSGGAPIDAASILTESLKEKLQTQTNLSLTNGGGDIVYTSYITGYDFTSVAPQAGETSALRKLTIRIEVEMDNRKMPEESWKANFSRFFEFSTDIDISQNESDFVQQITNELVDDIYNKSFVKW